MSEQEFNLEPMGEKIFAKIEEVENVRPSGIFLPDEAKQKSDRATVIAVGPGRYENGHLVPPNVKVGDVIVFSPYGGAVFEFEDKEYLVLREADILGRVRNP